MVMLVLMVGIPEDGAPRSDGSIPVHDHFTY